MLTTVAQVLAVLAVLGNGIVYGTDVLAGLVMRSVYQRLDDRTMTISAGWGHYYADRRMPFAGVTGMVGTALVLALSVISGHVAAAVAAGIALAALLIWMGIYVRIAKPVNSAQTAAAQSGVIPSNARALQEKWDSVVGLRIALQASAIIALCATLALV